MTRKTMKAIITMLIIAMFTIALPVQASAASAKLSKTSISLTVGKSATLSVKNYKKTVKWSSSNKKVATVSSKGKVTAKKAGTAKITAKAGSKKLTCKVTVKNPKTVKVSKVTLNKSKVNLTIGTTYTLKATVKPSNATNKNVTWSSSNKKVATVSSKGKVTAKKKGSTTITVKTKDGSKKAACKVTVVATYDEMTQSGDENDSNVCKIYGHTWGSPTVKRQPTCAQEGYYTHTCIWCGKTEKVSTPKTMGHTWQTLSHHAPTQKENWVRDYAKCTVCGATSEIPCDTLGAKGHPDWWTLAGGEAEAVNRIKLYRQNEDKIHDPYATDGSATCEGWIIELNTYIWQVGRFSISTKDGQPYGGGWEPGVQYYDASKFNPLYDLRVGDGIHFAHSGNYYTDKDGNRVRSGHWLVITSITRDASGKMISYHTAECGDMNSRLKGIPDWHDDKPDYDPNSIGGLVQAFNSGKIDQVMTFWPDIWTKVQ